MPELTVGDRLLLVYYLAQGQAREACRDRDAESRIVRRVTGLTDAEVMRSFDEVADVPARLQSFSYAAGTMSPVERVVCVRAMGRAGVWPPGVDDTAKEIELAAKLLGVAVLEVAVAHDALADKGFLAQR